MWLGSIFDKKHKMWDQLTTFWSLDRAEKHYSLKEQPLNMPLGSQNPYAKRAYYHPLQRKVVVRGASLQGTSWGRTSPGPFVLCREVVLFSEVIDISGRVPYWRNRRFIVLTTCYLQWNLRIADTVWTHPFVLCREVVLFWRLFCTECVY